MQKNSLCSKSWTLMDATRRLGIKLGAFAIILAQKQADMERKT